MNIELSRGRKILMYISILLTGIAVMGEMGIMPFVYDLYGAFDNVMAVNFVISGSALFVLIGSLLFTWLMHKFGKKQLLLLATIIFCTASIFCAAIDNVYYICVMRALMGLGEGATNAVVMAYVAQIFLDENKRASFMGYYNAAMTGFAIIMSYVSGVLASVRWQNAFMLYIPSALMIVGVLLFVPQISNLEEESGKEQRPGGKKEPLGKLYLFFIVDYVIFTWMYCIMSYYVSAYVAENGMGGAYYAGILTSLTQVGGFVCALLFGRIYEKLKKNTSIVCIIGVSIALILMYFVRTNAIAILASLVIGGLYGIYFAYSYAYVVEIVPVSRIDDAIGYTTAIYGVAFFVFPYLAGFAASLLSSEGAFTPVFLLIGIIGVIPLVLELVSGKPYQELQKKKERQEYGTAK